MTFLWLFSSGPSTAATTESGTDINATLTAVNSSQESGNDGGHQPSLTMLQFKGVVPQPNGRWGAQIYEGHERVWLGTFPDQSAAARAYDVAALRYRGREAATNFDMVAGQQQQQLAFLAAHSKSEIVDMLRNQTYPDELRHGVLRRGVPVAAWARVPLFEKAVTPSDVGKLSRLVVPRKHAERHLPPVQKGGVIFLGFVDGESGKVWRFRYSYWESSRSYVLTKGWIRFVRDKGLRAGDTVAFSRWTFGSDVQLLIDYRKKKQQPEKKDAGTVVKLFGVDIVV